MVIITDNISNVNIIQQAGIHKAIDGAPKEANNSAEQPAAAPIHDPSAAVSVDMSSNVEEKTPLIEENGEAPTEKPENKDSDKKDKRHHRHRHGKPKEEVTFRTHITTLAHLSVLVFVYHIFKLSWRGDFEFFTWHPMLMAVGWMLLMTEGFFVINKYNTYWRKKIKGGLRVKIHMIILLTGYTLAVIAFAIAYINKENKGKSHFVSWHGLFGLIGLVCSFPPIINGFLLWYSKELSNYIGSPKRLKFIHVFSGTAAFSFGALALMTSVYTNWYAKKTLRSDSVFYFGLVTVVFPLVWAVYGPSVKLARVIKEYFSEDKED